MLTHRNVPVYACTCACICTCTCTCVSVLHALEKDMSINIVLHVHLCSVVQLTWKKLFKLSSRDHGTLGHFCSLLRRLPAAKKPKDEMNACVDILLTVLKGHYIAAACSILGISASDEIPKNLPNLSTRESKMKFIAELSRQVVEQWSINSDAILRKPLTPTKDGVYEYARLFCHYASLAFLLKSSWEHGNGEILCKNWKVFLMHFYHDRRTKYAWEALRLQFQLANVPPSLSLQVKWGRFVNTHGGAGHNIPCDLHNEHLNGLFKDIIHSMGSNLTEHSMRRAARSVTSLCKIREAFDTESNVPVMTSAHCTKDDHDDVTKVVEVLLKNEVLVVKVGRKHSQFNDININPFIGLNYKSMFEWIEKKKTEVLKLKIACGEGDLSGSDSESSTEDDA